MSGVHDVAEIQPIILKLVQAHQQTKALEVGITTDTDLLEAGLTSFDMVQIVLGIEKEFGLKFPDEELSPDNFKNVASIAVVTEKVLKGRALV